jgi:hypothetical protein
LRSLAIAAYRVADQLGNKAVFATSQTAHGTLLRAQTSEVEAIG